MRTPHGQVSEVGVWFPDPNTPGNEAKFIPLDEAYWNAMEIQLIRQVQIYSVLKSYSRWVARVRKSYGEENWYGEW